MNMHGQRRTSFCLLFLLLPSNVTDSPPWITCYEDSLSSNGFPWCQEGIVTNILRAFFWFIYPPFKHTLIMITQPKLGQQLATLRETSRFCILQSYKTMPTLIVWWVKVDQASDHCCPCKCLLLTRGSSHMERAAYQPLDANKAQSVSGAQPVNCSSYRQTKNMQPEVSLLYKSAWNSLFF